MQPKPCPHCGTVFTPRQARSKYCSRPCQYANGKGAPREAESWWTNAKGYIEGRVWIGDKQVRVKQHRWIVEQCIGRSLRPDEDVHHVNGIKSDNRIENLQVLSHGDHAAETNTGLSRTKGKKLDLSPAERLARASRMRALRKVETGIPEVP